MNIDSSPLWFLSIIFKAMLWQCFLFSSEASRGMPTIVNSSHAGNQGIPSELVSEEAFISKVLIAQNRTSFRI